MQAKFFSPVHVEPLADGINWRLVKSLKYEDSDGRLIIVPAGFTTDFASIPPLSTIGGVIIALGLAVRRFVWLSAVMTLLGLVPVLLAHTLEGDDQLDGPATLHDYGYRVVRGSKPYWDGVLFRAMGATKRPLWKRLTIWVSVSLGGWSAWRNDSKSR